MNFDERRAKTKKLLQHHYGKLVASPQKKEKWEWGEDNNFGFLLGLVEHGEEEHIDHLYSSLTLDQFTNEKQDFIDEMFAYYIWPFHKNYGKKCAASSSAASSSSHSRKTASVASSQGGSSNNNRKRPSSAASKGGFSKSLKQTTDGFQRPSSRKSDTNSSGTKQRILKDALVKRDEVCLFCWQDLSLHGAHIAAQKNVPFYQDNESTLLKRFGLRDIYQVQNGLLLCIFCHDQFDQLKRYVDIAGAVEVADTSEAADTSEVVDTSEVANTVEVAESVENGKQLVVKIVNETNDGNNEKWTRAIEALQSLRITGVKYWAEKDNRKACDDNGEMSLYFVENNQSDLPNRKALKYHMIACLIWQMAGGAESDVEYFSDDEDVDPVDTAALRKRFNIQDSSDTLLMGLDAGGCG